jgi:GGDEF domain-containing protein
VDKALDAREVAVRLRCLVLRTRSARAASPLSGLPGGVSIESEIARRIGTGGQFAVIYADIDQFKAFNDRYGFLKGDEVLVRTSEILAEAVDGAAVDGVFLGHIGGDDFVVITEPDSASAICQRIIEGFDAAAPSFYSPEDRAAGSIEVTDRRGVTHQVPLMTISLAVVTNERRLLDHPGKVSQIASEIKRYSKTLPGSVWVKDRRTDPGL